MPSDSILTMHAIALLLEAGDAVAEMHLRVGLLAQDVELDRREAVLLEVQAVGMVGDVREQAEVELGHQARRAGSRTCQWRTCSPCWCICCVMPYFAIMSCVGGW